MPFLPRTQHWTKIGPDMKKCGIWKQKPIIDNQDFKCFIGGFYIFLFFFRSIYLFTSRHNSSSQQ
jgi:hypothetical protein